MCGPKFCSYKITQKIVKEHGEAIDNMVGWFKTKIILIKI
jgi:phosphomethylpyrimidine synthase